MKKKASTALTYSSSLYVSWYETMLLMRRFEEKTGQLYAEQKFRGFCHMYTGQEACVAGCVSALQKKDKYITAYRDHVHPLALGTHPKYVMAELLGKSTGVSKGRGGSMHIFDKENHFFGGHGIVGGQIPLGIGIAFAEKYKKTNNICITFMGDGAVRQGTFHESLNLAMLYKLPVLFIIENNGYAMGTSVERSSNVTELYRLGAAYDMPSLAVDAMCVESVHEAVEAAAKKAREGLPSLLEFKTYRYRGHSVSDPAKYRTKDEVEEFKQKDPIKKLRDTIIKKKIASEATLNEIDEKIKSLIEESVAFAEASPYPTADEVYHYIYAETDYPFLMS